MECLNQNANNSLAKSNSSIMLQYLFLPFNNIAFISSNLLCPLDISAILGYLESWKVVLDLLECPNDIFGDMSSQNFPEGRRK